MMPLVSIAVPVYGAEKFIERCVVSLFEQTYSNLEYVFVNDSTKDKSIEILEKIMQRYPNRIHSVKVIHHKNNCGLAVTRNDAIANCTGDFVLNVDNDDWLEKNAVELLVLKQQEKNADIVWGSAFINDDKEDDRFNTPTIREKEALIEYLLSYQHHHEIWGKLIRRSLYVDNEIKVERGCNSCDDWQVLPRLIYYSKIIEFVDEKIYHYRQHPNSITRLETNKYKYTRDELLSLSILYDFFKDSQYNSAIAKLYINRVFYHMMLAMQGGNKNLFVEWEELLQCCYPTDVRRVIGRFPSLKRNYYTLKLYSIIRSLLSK